MSLARLLEQVIGPTPWLIANSEVLGITTADYSHDIAYDVGPEDSEAAWATARLIALAPDMAQLLIDMADYIRRDVVASAALPSRDALLARFAKLDGQAKEGT